MKTIVKIAMTCLLPFWLIGLGLMFAVLVANKYLKLFQFSYTDAFAEVVVLCEVCGIVQSILAGVLFYFGFLYCGSVILVGPTLLLVFLIFTDILWEVING
jgi:hypothetical protein